MTRPARSTAAVRNSAPILDVLRHELQACSDVLEIGSGCGYHAVTFAAAMPNLRWQTSDLDENHDQIAAQIAAAAADNVLAPLSLDVRTAEAPDREYDAVYSCNTAHIMSMAAAERMLQMVDDVLKPAGVFCYYGPLTRQGRFNAPSNAAFDASLRARDPLMGVRELDDLDATLDANGILRQSIHAMPANNLFVVWRKTEIKE